LKSYREVITKHRDEIIRMREEGKTLKEIAEYFNCPTIAHSGLPGFPAPKRESTLRKAQEALKEHEEEIRQLRKEGKTWQEISEILGIPGLDRVKHTGFARTAARHPSLEKDKLFKGLLYINESKKIKAYIAELKKSRNSYRLCRF
jgi:DNA-binding transcriptional MerR regulator